MSLSQEKYLRELLKQAILEVFSQKKDLFSLLMKEALKNMAGLDTEEKSQKSDPPDWPEEVAEPEPQGDGEEVSPVIKLVDRLIEDGFSQRASSLHLQPEQEGLLVRYKVGGAFQKGQGISGELKKTVILRIKILAGMDLSVQNLPQDGQIIWKKKGQTLMVSTLPTLGGERLVLQFQRPGAQSHLSIDDLGFSARQKGWMENQIEASRGWIIAFGPTNSGKTTLLYALLVQLDPLKKNIITLESPPEQPLDHISQLEYHSSGLTLSRALSTVVRQEPDLLLCKIEDSDSAHTLCQTSLNTLVLSSMHTTTPGQTMVRLLDMGLSPHLVSITLRALVGCHLFRRLCPHCKTAYRANLAQREWLGEEGDIELFCGRGCDHCGQTGYLGARGIYEILVVDEEVQALVLRGNKTDELAKKLDNKTFSSFEQALFQSVKQGEISFEDALGESEKT